MKEQAIVRVSPLAGGARSVWVQEVQANGWLRGTPDEDDAPGTSAWYAPHHIVWRGEGTKTFDWGGIKPGTLVRLMDDSVGLVVSRKGATLIVNVADKGIKRVEYRYVRPLDDVV